MKSGVIPDVDIHTFAPNPKHERNGKHCYHSRACGPFVIGILRPRIYLPSTQREEEQSYVILHEQTHIRRLDHLVKMFAFLALAVHWFNPLVWVAFVYAVKDMEMSCDECVIKLMGSDIRGEYSTSLLSLAAEKRLINGSPLAFGEENIKGRISNVMNFKKPAAWVAAISVGTDSASEGAYRLQLYNHKDWSIIHGESEYRLALVDTDGDKMCQLSHDTCYRFKNWLEQYLNRLFPLKKVQASENKGKLTPIYHKVALNPSPKRPIWVFFYF
jgi:hypothetical protein